MPVRPHRTVDRVVEILETVSLSQRGVTLAELATALGAAKSSVQELTNGLLARGYLIEEDRRFHLGPGPFIRGARRGRHRLHRPCGRRIPQPDLRRTYPRPTPALYQRRRKDAAGQRPRRR